MPTVGVLALQGDVREHVAALGRLEVTNREVRTPSDLELVDALIIPGGESTAIAHLLSTSHLREPLGERLAAGMAVLGTCAGLILLAAEILDGRRDQWSYGALDLSVRRNGYGRQIASFEATVEVQGIGPVTGVFIRAPRIERVGDGVSVLATHDHGDGERAVLVRQGNVTGCAFHPELARDDRIHESFVRALG